MLQQAAQTKNKKTPKGNKQKSKESSPVKNESPYAAKKAVAADRTKRSGSDSKSGQRRSSESPQYSGSQVRAKRNLADNDFKSDLNQNKLAVNLKPSIPSKVEGDLPARHSSRATAKVEEKDSSNKLKEENAKSKQVVPQ